MGAPMDDPIVRAFFDRVDFANAAAYLIIKAGGMANRSALDEIVAERYGLSSGDARDITNSRDAHDERTPYRIDWPSPGGKGKVRWTSAAVPEPRYADHLEVLPYLPRIEVERAQSGGYTARLHKGDRRDAPTDVFASDAEALSAVRCGAFAQAVIIAPAEAIDELTKIFSGEIVARPRPIAEHTKHVAE